MSESNGGLGGNTTTKQELREPLSILQYDPNGSAVACAANTMHMLGYATPFSDPEFIHGQIGREYGELAFSDPIYLWMLKNGVNIHFMNPFDFDEYKARGVEYLIERYPEQASDEEAFRAHFTEEFVRNRIAEREESEQAMREVGGYTEDVATPSISDVQRFVNDGKVVQLYLRTDKISSYPVLAYQVVDEGKIGIYAPSLFENDGILPLVGEHDLEEISSLMDVNNGIEVFSKAD